MSNIIGIIFPMKIESEYFLSRLDNKEIFNDDSFHYNTGYIGSTKFIVVNSGIGLANAAMTTTWLVLKFKPNLLFISGSAGSVKTQLSIGDTIIASEVYNADLGELTTKGIFFPERIANPNKNIFAPLNYITEKIILEDIKKIDIALPSKSKIYFGKVATSEFLPNPKSQIDKLIEDDVLAVAMEDSAVKHVGWYFNTPVVVVRSISNVSGSEITNQGNIIAARNAAIVSIEISKYI